VPTTRSTTEECSSFLNDHLWAQIPFRACTIADLESQQKQGASGATFPDTISRERKWWLHAVSAAGTYPKPGFRVRPALAPRIGVGETRNRLSEGGAIVRDLSEYSSQTGTKRYRLPDAEPRFHRPLLCLVGVRDSHRANRTLEVEGSTPFGPTFLFSRTDNRSCVRGVLPRPHAQRLLYGENAAALRSAGLFAVTWGGLLGIHSWREDLAQHGKHCIAGALVHLSQSASQARFVYRTQLIKDHLAVLAAKLAPDTRRVRMTRRRHGRHDDGADMAAAPVTRVETITVASHSMRSSCT